MKYDYREAVEEDVRKWVQENVNKGDYDYYDLSNYLYDTLVTEDSVTGNGSGSYCCNADQAEECLKGNLDILADAFWDFGYDAIGIDKALRDANTCDVIIRCYLLGEAIYTVVEELNCNGFFDDEEEGEDNDSN